MSESLKAIIPILIVAALLVVFLAFKKNDGSDAELSVLPTVPSTVEFQSLNTRQKFDPVPEVSPMDINGYLARIMLDSPEDVEQALLRAEQLYHEGKIRDSDNPFAFVLHGPEVHIFFKDNYQRYKSIVDLAARLSAFEVVDVKVCQTRLRQLGETEDVLPPFVETVPFGPAEIERLIVSEQYVYF